MSTATGKEDVCDPSRRACLTQSQQQRNESEGVQVLIQGARSESPGSASHLGTSVRARVVSPTRPFAFTPGTRTPWALDETIAATSAAPCDNAPSAVPLADVARTCMQRKELQI